MYHIGFSVSVSLRDKKDTIGAVKKSMGLNLRDMEHYLSDILNYFRRRDNYIPLNNAISFLKKRNFLQKFFHLHLPLDFELDKEFHWHVSDPWEDD